MKKNYILLLIGILLVLVSTGCFNSGITKDAKININNTSNTHEEKDIERVIKKVKKEFTSFTNCRLLTIDYDSVNQNIKDWEDVEYYDIMVINFTFKCEGDSMTFSKDETYYYYTAYYGKLYKNLDWSLITMGQG